MSVLSTPKAFFLTVKTLDANEDTRWTLLKRNRVNIAHNIIYMCTRDVGEGRGEGTVASTDG